jgi:hypothetical protein
MMRAFLVCAEAKVADAASKHIRSRLFMILASLYLLARHKSDLRG